MQTQDHTMNEALQIYALIAALGAAYLVHKAIS